MKAEKHLYNRRFGNRHVYLTGMPESAAFAAS